MLSSLSKLRRNVQGCALFHLSRSHELAAGQTQLSMLETMDVRFHVWSIRKHGTEGTWWSHITHKPSLCALGDMRCLCVPYKLHFFFSINSNPAKTSQCLQNLMQAICWRGFSVFRLIKCKTVGEDLTKSTDADLENMSVIFFLGYRTTILVEDCGAWQTLLDRQLSLSVRFSCLPMHTILPTTCVTSDLWLTQGQIPLRYERQAKHLGSPPCYALSYSYIWHSIHRNRIIQSTLPEWSSCHWRLIFASLVSWKTMI